MEKKQALPFFFASNTPSACLLPIGPISKIPPFISSTRPLGFNDAMGFLDNACD